MEPVIQWSMAGTGSTSITSYHGISIQWSMAGTGSTSITSYHGISIQWSMASNGQIAVVPLSLLNAMCHIPITVSWLQVQLEVHVHVHVCYEIFIKFSVY